MPLDEFPDILRSRADPSVSQMFRDLPRTLPIIPCLQYLIPERHQDAMAFAVFFAGVGTARKSADRKQLFGAVMPVFRGFPFELPIGLGTVERQDVLQICFPRAPNAPANVVLFTSIIFLPPWLKV